MWLQCDCTCPLVLSPSGLDWQSGHLGWSLFEIFSPIFPCPSWFYAVPPEDSVCLADVFSSLFFLIKESREEGSCYSGNECGGSGSEYSQVREPKKIAARLRFGYSMPILMDEFEA